MTFKCIEPTLAFLLPLMANFIVLGAQKLIELFRSAVERVPPHQAGQLGYRFHGGQPDRAVLMNDFDEFAVECALDKLEQILSKVSRRDGHWIHCTR